MVYPPLREREPEKMRLLMQGGFASTLVIEMGVDNASRIREVE
jgi:hypothetical protein